MKTSEFVACASVLCMLGCSAEVGEDPATQHPDVPREHDPKRPVPPADPADASLLIRGNVTTTFTLEKPGECRPLGVPVIWFVSGLLGQEALVEETATPVSDTECLHEQVMAAPANAWAALAYTTVCSGGDDTRLCGAQASRQCSVDLLLRWSADRTEPVVVSVSTLAFDYVMPPLDRAARRALDRRALQEVSTLIAESEAVLNQASAGARDCPNEDDEQIRASYFAALELQRELSTRLNR